MSRPWGDRQATPLRIESRSGMFQVWDEPAHEQSYIVGADVSEGRMRDIVVSRRSTGVIQSRDDRPDFSAAIVIEKETGQHVASWHGYVEPSEFAAVLTAIGLTYNKALIVPELNGPGVAVVDVLVQVFRYPNVYRAKVWNQADVTDWIGTQFGWRTTTVTRPMLINRVHEVVNTGQLFTRDKDLIDELRTMEYDEQGRARARGKHKDDRVLALGLALQGRYELLYGIIDHSQRNKLSHLPARDRAVWEKVFDQQKRSEKRRGNALRGDGLRLPPLSRPLPLPR